MPQCQLNVLLNVLQKEFINVLYRGQICTTGKSGGYDGLQRRAEENVFGRQRITLLTRKCPYWFRITVIPTVYKHGEQEVRASENKTG